MPKTCIEPHKLSDIFQGATTISYGPFSMKKPDAELWEKANLFYRENSQDVSVPLTAHQNYIMAYLIGLRGHPLSPAMARTTDHSLRNLVYRLQEKLTRATGGSTASDHITFAEVRWYEKCERRKPRKACTYRLRLSG